MKKNGNFSVQEYRALRNTIKDGLTSIEIKPYLKKENAFIMAKNNGAVNLTKNMLEYMVEQKLVVPEANDDDRPTHLYGREQICDVILIQKLKKIGLPYAKISSLMRIAQNQDSENNRSKFNNGSDVVLPHQGARAKTLLNSRVIAVLINHLLGSAIKPGIIIHLRERLNNPSNNNTSHSNGVARMDHELLNRVEADNYVDLVRPDDDITAFVSSDPERDVIFHKFEIRSILDFDREHWLRITVKIGNPVSQYDLMIGSDDKASFEYLEIKNGSFEAKIVGTLMKILFSKASNPSSTDNVVSANKFDKSTMLNVLVNMIPDLSNLWEYCAILTLSSEKPNHLKVSAVSRDFPLGMRDEIQNIQIEPGQPLAGWSFQTTYPIVIQQVNGSNDPRLAYQNKESATAAIAIPTKAQGSHNGVLYVGTRYTIPAETPAFSEAEIRSLQIIADVAGEMIERNRITRIFEFNSSKTIALPELSTHDWPHLSDKIHNILESLIQTTSTPLDNDNLHFTIVKIESHNALTQKDPAISEWVNKHILETTRDFFIRKGFEIPEIYIHNPPYSVIQAWEFVCLIQKLEITDEQDRKMRKELRELLSSLKLAFSFEDVFQVTTNVWSMPFRFKGLLNRIDPKSSGTKIRLVTDEIMSEIEDAFLIIPYIELAHHHEESGAYPSALEQYISAAYFAPHNRYIQRHIAKMYAAIGDLKNSAHHWQKIVQEEEYPRYFLHYADILARMGDSAKADENFSKAFQLDSTSLNTLIEWGDFLAVEGKTDDAISKYEQALKLDITNRDLIWFRFAEIYFEAGDLQNANSFTKLILARLPDHREAQRLMLKILKKERGSPDEIITKPTS